MLFSVGPVLNMDVTPRRAGLEAMGLWLICGTFSVHNGTPGRITRGQVRQFTTKRKPINQLVESGFWSETADGWEFSADGQFWRAVERQRASIAPSLRQLVYDRDGHACVTCGSTEDLTLDHIYPWSLGGPDTEENLQTMCRSCNSSKGARVAL